MLSTRAEEASLDADLDLDPEDNFTDLRSALSELESFFEDDEPAADLISGLSDTIDERVEEVEKRKREKDAEKEERRSWSWDDYAPAKTTPIKSYDRRSVRWKPLYLQ